MKRQGFGKKKLNVFGRIKRKLLYSRLIKLFAARYFFNFFGNCIYINCFGSSPQRPKHNGNIGAMAFACFRQRPVQQ